MFTARLVKSTVIQSFALLLGFSPVPSTTDAFAQSGFCAQLTQTHQCSATITIPRFGHSFYPSDSKTIPFSIAANTANVGAITGTAVFTITDPYGVGTTQYIPFDLSPGQTLSPTAAQLPATCH